MVVPPQSKANCSSSPERLVPVSRFEAIAPKPCWSGQSQEAPPPAPSNSQAEQAVRGRKTQSPRTTWELVKKSENALAHLPASATPLARVPHSPTPSRRGSAVLPTAKCDISAPRTPVGQQKDRWRNARICHPGIDSVLHFRR